MKQLNLRLRGFQQDSGKMYVWMSVCCYAIVVLCGFFLFVFFFWVFCFGFWVFCVCVFLRFRFGLVRFVFVILFLCWFCVLFWMQGVVHVLCGFNLRCPWR